MLILLVLVYGCAATLSSLPTPGKNIAKEQPFEASGLTNKGVEVKFMERAPPQKTIYLGDSFNVKLKLKNWGTEAVDGRVKISDTLTEGLSAISEGTDNSFDLQGIDKERRTPKEEIIDFGEFSYNNREILRTYMVAVIEYDYRAELKTDLCVRSEDAQVGTIQCRYEENFGVNSLGWDASHAPVTVTSIRKELTTTSGGAVIRLIMKFKDFGGSSGNINNNDNSLDISNAVKLGGEGFFKCRPSLLRFVKGEKTKEAICTLRVNLPEEGFFRSPLLISLNYPYKSRVSTNSIEIKDIDETSRGF